MSDPNLTQVLETNDFTLLTSNKCDVVVEKNEIISPLSGNNNNTELHKTKRFTLLNNITKSMLTILRSNTNEYCICHKNQYVDNNDFKAIKQNDYTLFFDKMTGESIRFGNCMDEDPYLSPGPEIADIEISTICHGIAGVGPCRFCYKGNNKRGKNMTLDTFKTILSKMPQTLTQIAFGIGDIDSNPDLMKIMMYSRENGVVPNITINGDRMTCDWYHKLASVCGSVAVSCYDYDICYESVSQLTSTDLSDMRSKLGLEPLQVNIHCLLSDKTLDICHKVIEDRQIDTRLSRLNAIVFLKLKPIGRAKNRYNQLTPDEFDELFQHIVRSKTIYGFDTCSTPDLVRAIESSTIFKDDGERESYKDKAYTVIDFCGSYFFSMYINVDGNSTPCSFQEQYVDTINVLDIEDIGKIWNSDIARSWRNNMSSNPTCRASYHPCPVPESCLCKACPLSLNMKNK